MIPSFVQVIHQRAIDRHFLPIHPHTHAFVFRGDHHAFFAHAPHHVERLLRLAPPCQFLDVGGYAAFDRGAHFLLDREEPVGRAEAVEPLVRSLVVVVLHPPRDPFPCLLEGFETRMNQELVLQGLPEPLDLPQRHRMMRSTADVMDVVLL